MLSSFYSSKVEVINVQRYNNLVLSTRKNEMEEKRNTGIKNRVMIERINYQLLKVETCNKKQDIFHFLV